jgi:hypothetical protein
LAAAALARNQLADAGQYAVALLEPSQQCLPDELVTILQKAVQAWQGEASQEASLQLCRALELARELGYL